MPDFENHMALNNDRTDSEQRVESKKYIEQYNYTLEQIDRILKDGSLNEVILGRPRKYWLPFYADEMVEENETIINILNNNQDAISQVHYRARRAIMNELGFEYED